MTVYYEYTQYYKPSPSAYEQSLLLSQSQQEISDLREKLHLQENSLGEKDEEIRLLKNKVENLLKGYNKRQANYSTALKVLNAKNADDSLELRELRAENKKLRQQIHGKVEALVESINDVKLVKGTFTLAEIEGSGGNPARGTSTLLGNEDPSKLIKGTYTVAEIESFGGNSTTITSSLPGIEDPSINLVKGIYTVVEIEALYNNQTSTTNQTVLTDEDPKPAVDAANIIDEGFETKQPPIKPVIIDVEKAEHKDEVATCWADLEPTDGACEIPDWADVGIVSPRVAVENGSCVIPEYDDADANFYIAADKDNTDVACNACVVVIDEQTQPQCLRGVYNVWDIEACIVRAHC